MKLIDFPLGAHVFEDTCYFFIGVFGVQILLSCQVLFLFMQIGLHEIRVRAKARILEACFTRERMI